jgi:protein-L-isoaspartate(D-aspartate) O-methyltransferase
MNDTFLHKGLRQKLVEKLRIKGITSEEVLTAIMNVPRHLFIAQGLERLAYEDQALPIGSEQTISQPYTVAFQTQLLNISKGEKILEIGTGSGYQAAVLAEMGAKVFSIERHHDLFQQSQQLLLNLGYNMQLFYGDGYLGKPTYAPFNKIIITAGVKEIPEQLIEQLSVNGRMVIPLGDNIQEMTLVIKNADNSLNISKHGQFSFVPFIKGKT